MTLDLSQLEFENDIYTVACNDGATLTLNKVDEDILLDGDELEVKRINIAYTDSDGNTDICSSIIGMTDSHIALTSAYSELQGAVLDDENMICCSLEILEDE